MNTLELDNRNIKKVFYSWLCHSETKSKILQEGEWSLSIRISNSLGDGIHKAASRWPPSKIRNSLTTFNLKLKWEKNVAFTILFNYLSMKALVIYISLHLKRSCWDSFGEHDSQWVFWSSFSYLCEGHYYQNAFMSLIILMLTFIKPPGCARLHIVRGNCKSQPCLTAHKNLLFLLRHKTRPRIIDHS